MRTHRLQVATLKASNEEIRDWEEKGVELLADLKSGRLAGALTLLLYSDGSLEYLPRGVLKSNPELRAYLCNAILSQYK